MTQETRAPGQASDAYAPDHHLELVTSPKWVRVFLAGEKIADSKRVLLLRESGQTPVYYFPPDDVEMDFLAPTAHMTQSSGKGQASYWTVKVNDTVAENAAWSYADPSSEASELANYIAFDWDAMEAWFEEDEQVFVHARDPYTRIDVIYSSRPVRVEIAGETVAETARPVLLFETGLPIRYYIPKIDVRMDLLVPSDAQTECPYKGTASYYTVEVEDTQMRNVVWYYPFPYPEIAKIQNMLAFFQEKVDDFYVDGERLLDVKTPWSED
jgi:uncharacterized protein (DUF427 family)